ncbi:hypothetical protein [Pseudomonas promysalinigenes]|uniref:Uncharacterized protein n=1 Tax=Pseudomonas promysalinigenes TaxID=485898 RepID=A0ABY6AF74_9PSED|nr:hypothetical protein [Pseudomonas promysalinigenes]UXH38151.1 hypothetical protein N5C08_14205 [Pseudomonas promysalinigenes]
MSVTLRCLKCEGEEFTKPRRLYRKSVLTCHRCNTIALYGDLLEAAGQRLMADLKVQLSRLKTG